MKKMKKILIRFGFFLNSIFSLSACSLLNPHNSSPMKDCLQVENFDFLVNHIEKNGTERKTDYDNFKEAVVKDWKIKYLEHEAIKTLSFFQDEALIGVIRKQEGKIEAFSLMKLKEANEKAKKKTELAFCETIKNLHESH